MRRYLGTQASDSDGVKDKVVENFHAVPPDTLSTGLIEIIENLVSFFPFFAFTSLLFSLLYPSFLSFVV